MSAKRYSPTASTLRSSRFFSLPPPLPRPQEFITSNSFVSNAQSPTATLPYPVQQAITTPASGRSRGDWGLKRSFPRKSTQKPSQPPVFRVNVVDTREHITDFDTASDLTATREKFLELGIPLSVREERSGLQTIVAASPFEPSSDNTDSKAAGKNPKTGQSVSRWKYEGPWLAGLSEQEFLDYVEQQLYGRREEFLAFLRQHEAQRREQEQAFGNATKYGRGARNAANSAHEKLLSSLTQASSPLAADDAPSDTSTLLDTTHPEASSLPQSQSMSDEEFSDYLREVRASFSTSSPLTDLVTRFLDLPILGSSIQDHVTSGGQGHFAITAEMHFARSPSNGTIATGPPTTHPSAGLSYLRTNAILPNHHIFGPLNQQHPTVARILTRRVEFLTQKGYLGVAGFVVQDSDKTRGDRKVIPEIRRQTLQGQQDNKPVPDQDARGNTMGISLEGGARIWVQAQGARVDQAGRVHLRLRSATHAEVDAKNMDLGGSEMSAYSMPASMTQQEYQAQNTTAGSMGQFSKRRMAQATGFRPLVRKTYGIGGGDQSSDELGAGAGGETQREGASGQGGEGNAHARKGTSMGDVLNQLSKPIRTRAGAARKRDPSDSGSTDK
ncbi:MAG: hypothetical protein Q9159_001020 [Coniocarpon cinnabarinum]